MYYDAKEYIRRICEKTDPEVFLSLLQEECAELSHAISKLLRATNTVYAPTPVSERQALDMVREEITDVQMMTDGVLFLFFGIEPGSDDMRDETLERAKWVRWLKRLEEDDE